MAENSKLTGIELNGVLYSLGKSIYEELDISLVRFAELLGRDFYCPTLSAAPTASTLKYTDTDGEQQTFQVGQPCRWADGNNYRIAVCKSVSSSSASWYILPTKVSELSNDAGYLTSHQNISHLATKTELATKQDAISDLETIRSGAAKGATALQSVPSEYVTETELINKGYATTSSVNSSLGNKVDKVSGKQLSTEDFTTALKNKLNGLSNYDDSTISAAINKLRTDFDTLVSGDTTTAIKSFNDIVAFLDGITDNEDLESIIASIEQQIAGKQDKIADLDAIRSGAAKGATALQSHQDISGKLDKTEAASTYLAKTDASNTYLGKNAKAADATKADSATKATQDASGNVITSTYATKTELSAKGTYSKPSTGIPKTDLASAVQTSLSKADTALQSYTETDPVFKASAAASITSSDISNWNSKTSNTGTITGIKMNGASKGTSGVVDLGTVITAHQDISGKQDKVLKFTNKTVSSWVSDNTYEDYPYRSDISCSGVTAEMYAEVVFNVAQSTSGKYAPVCETKSNVVSVWSSENTSITIPTIIITK